jgi:hypothetical protein
MSKELYEKYLKRQLDTVSEASEMIYHRVQNLERENERLRKENNNLSKRIEVMRKLWSERRSSDSSQDESDQVEQTPLS